MTNARDIYPGFTYDISNSISGQDSYEFRNLLDFIFEKTSKMEKSKAFHPFSPGPLDAYRKNATFDWYDMKRFIEGEDILEFKEQIWSTMEKDPLFQRTKQRLSMEEKRRLNLIRLKRMVEYDFLSDEAMIQNPMKIYGINDAMGSYNWGLMAKMMLQYQVTHFPLPTPLLPSFPLKMKRK